MSSGKTIHVFLIDGTPTGIRTAHLDNWNGKAVVSQRSQLPTLAQRDEAKLTGVYILIGQDTEDSSRERVYIGEGDSVLDRLLAHDKDANKDFWSQVVFFVSQDGNLTKAHIRYLERELIQLAETAGRVRIANDQRPDTRTRLLPEHEVANMQGFLEQMRLILPVLGFPLLQAVPTHEQLLKSPTGEDFSPLFMMNPVGTSAKGREVRGEFVVLKGSTARKEGNKNWTGSYRELRDRLVREKKLILATDSNFYEFQGDVAFTSPSAAAIIYGGNQNGRITWKIIGTNTTYGGWKDAQLPAVYQQNTSEDA